MLTSNKFNAELIEFLTEATTPFHAVKIMSEKLENAGFSRLHESDSWDVEYPGKYYLTRNDSSIIAFVSNGEPLTETGFKMLGAHTDSPCLKVKPNPELNKHGYCQLGVEVYGGALLNPWFDRDLSLAGKVTYRNLNGELESELVDFKRPVAIIPSLAIHLDREANKSRSINPQNDIPPLLVLENSENDFDFRDILKLELANNDIDAEQVIDFEICLYDTQPPDIIGLNNEFIASQRLDNLLSCFVGLQAIINSGNSNVLLVCNDHEEVGSTSACGAQGPMLKQLLSRLLPDVQDYARLVDNSIMFSVDNAHAVHPNYANMHDGNHLPMMNGGPVIKVNHNQRYATNSETSALFKTLCDEVGIKVQTFVTRTDLACGSTIGPLTAAEVGVKTIDLGLPTFAMHSIRELAGADDAFSLFKVLKQFYS